MISRSIAWAHADRDPDLRRPHGPGRDRPLRGPVAPAGGGAPLRRQGGGAEANRHRRPGRAGRPGAQRPGLPRGGAGAWRHRQPAPDAGPGGAGLASRRPPRLHLDHVGVHWRPGPGRGRNPGGQTRHHPLGISGPPAGARRRAGHAAGGRGRQGDHGRRGLCRDRHGADLGEQAGRRPGGAGDPAGDRVRPGPALRQRLARQGLRRDDRARPCRRRARSRAKPAPRSFRRGR